MCFKDRLFDIGAVIDLADRLGIEEALPQKRKPLLQNLDDFIAGRAGTRIEFHPNGGKKTPTGKDLSLEVREK